MGWQLLPRMTNYFAERNALAIALSISLPMLVLTLRWAVTPLPNISEAAFNNSRAENEFLLDLELFTFVGLFIGEDLIDELTNSG